MNTNLPMTSSENIARITSVVTPQAASCAGCPVFLVDGDRTLSPEDTSQMFMSLAGANQTHVKERFQREGYVFSSFRFHAAEHLRLGKAVFDALAPKVAERALLNPGAAEFLRRATTCGCVFVVSAGIPRIWRGILDRLELPDVGVIGGIDPSDAYVFGRSEKALTAEIFFRYASRLVAVGDSDVDTEMLLRAHHAVLVVNHRQNADVLPYVAGHSSIWQVVPQGKAHPRIPELSFPAIADLIQLPRVTAQREEYTCP